MACSSRLRSLFASLGVPSPRDWPDTVCHLPARPAFPQAKTATDSVGIFLTRHAVANAHFPSSKAT